VGNHFYWLSSTDGGLLPALFYDTPLRGFAQSLVAPGEIEIAFNQLQVALNIPPFSHRPGGHHSDGYLEGHQAPYTFTMLAGVLMTEQKIENAGNLWVWPETHRTRAAFFRERGPDALVESKGYPKIELPEPSQFLGGPGDVILAHYMLGHNIGGNYASERARQAVYFRLRGVGHERRWRECLAMNCWKLIPSARLWINFTSHNGNSDGVGRSAKQRGNMPQRESQPFDYGSSSNISATRFSRVMAAGSSATATRLSEVKPERLQ
jgi:hypothetical protein